jgi:8-oxo-dGTP pyrophosphatase MutT (NUDIX family)
MNGDDPRGSARPWRVLSSTMTFADRWLKVRTDRCLTADGVEVSPYHVIVSANWTSVVALTPDLRLLTIQEYRHARERVIMGIPGGVIETEDAPEDGTGDAVKVAEIGARRELLEETGYGGGRFIHTLTTYPDPANQTNVAINFLALGVERVGAQSLDKGEAIDVTLDHLPRVLTGLITGDIRMHAVHVAALWSAAALIIAGGADVAEAAPLREKLLAAITGARG